MLVGSHNPYRAVTTNTIYSEITGIHRETKQFPQGSVEPGFKPKQLGTPRAFSTT